MKEEHFPAYISILFPYKFLVDEYNHLLYTAFPSFGINNIDTFYQQMIMQRVLLVDNSDHIFVNPDYVDRIYEEFINLSEIVKNLVIENSGEAIKNFFNASDFSEIIDIYFSLIKRNSGETIKNAIERRLYSIMSSEKTDLNFLSDILKIFSSLFISDEIRIALISVLYRYNQNNLVVFFYDKIKNVSKIPANILLEISSAFFMLQDIKSAKEIIALVKDVSNDETVLTALKIVELINDYESTDDQNRDRLKENFYHLVSKVESVPNCANLLLKVSSSILSHKDAINLMIKSKLNDNIVQVYNNIGALYLSEGYKNFVKDSKDKEFLYKAGKYLEFAKTLSEEQKTYSPYLTLNLLTYRFCNEFRKKAINKKYSTIYNKYKKLKNKADSIYFQSIIFANCFVLEMLTQNNTEVLNEYIVTLKKISDNSNDIKIKEKKMIF